MASQLTPSKNFWLWGVWGKRRINPPFCTQKVPGKIRDVIIGHTFIVALTAEGKLKSWGEDKSGCLGHGTELLHCAEPNEIKFPVDTESSTIIEVQYGKHHILALTDQGRVFAWGENSCGQLGQNDTQARYDPVCIDELKSQTVVQILAMDNASYALTDKGLVYAWGENKEGSLALDHDSPRVMKPEPMMTMQDTKVKKLQIKECGGIGGGKGGKTIIAFVELADPLTEKDMPGGFDRPLGEGKENEANVVLESSNEKDIFEGVDLMRRVMDNTNDWYNHMLDVRHGAPYDDAPGESDVTPFQLDTHVSLDVLEKAAYELEQLVKSARQQLQEIRAKRGTKNVKFMLTLFMDDCRLRREKIQRTISARQFVDTKKEFKDNFMGAQGERHHQGELEMLQAAQRELSKKVNRVRAIPADDVFTRSLQDSLSESIECKLQVYELQIQFFKSRKSSDGVPDYQEMIAPALRTIQERWKQLKDFSIANLYREHFAKNRMFTFSSDDELLAYLVQKSDGRIDQIITTDKNSAVSRDSLVPNLCYNLLVENAELRKMCNTYQLKVLRQRDASAEKAQ